MDYSHCSALVVVLIVVGAGYVFLRDKNWSVIVQIWTKDTAPKARKIFSHDLDPKVKGQNQRPNISFCDKFMMSKITSPVNFGAQVVYMDIGEGRYFGVQVVYMDIGEGL